VLSRIQSRFAETESEFWASSMTIAGFERVRPIGFRPWGLDFVPRLFCTGTALMADGRPVDAFFNQPFATFLAASCAIGLVLALTELIQPSGPATRALTWLSERDASAAAIFLVLMFSGWTYKIAVTLNFF
jgi:hypothetical protein